MKKKLLFIILAAAAVLVIVGAIILTVALSSDVADYSDLINDEAAFIPESVLSRAEIITDLTTATFGGQEPAAHLVYFTSIAESGTQNYERHIIYNMESGAVVYTGTETDRTEITVSANTLTWNGNDEPYFIVETTSWSDSTRLPATEAHSTVLYDQNGTQLEIATQAVAATAQLDLLYFNGKYYRASEAGGIALAFNYSPLAATPNLTDKHGEYYYARTANNILVYDSTLSLVSRYDIPTYAIGVTSVILESGDIFLQYQYASDEFHTEDYDLIAITQDQNGQNTQTKTKLVSALIDYKSGEAEPIECQYVVRAANTITYNQTIAQDLGINLDDYSVLAVAVPIENKREAQQVRMVAIDNSGEIVEFERIQGDYLNAIIQFTQGFWEVSTSANRTFLINTEGDVTLEITNATVCGSLLICDNKIYSTDMTMLYDLTAHNMTVRYRFDGTMLLENADGEIFFYTGVGEPTKLIEKDSQLRLAGIHNRFFVIRDPHDTSCTFHVYNVAGTELIAIEKSLAESNTFGSIVASTDNAIVITMTNNEGNAVYYRLAA